MYHMPTSSLLAYEKKLSLAYLPILRRIHKGVPRPPYIFCHEQEVQPLPCLSCTIIIPFWTPDHLRLVIACQR